MAAGLLGYTMLMYRLFYQQAVHCATRELYFSDIKAYLETILGVECDYDFPYPVFFWSMVRKRKRMCRGDTRASGRHLCHSVYFLYLCCICRGDLAFWG